MKLSLCSYRVQVRFPTIAGLQAANIAAAFRKVGGVAAERRIPAVVLRGAAGFAILSMAKVLVLRLCHLLSLIVRTWNCAPFATRLPRS